MTLGFGEAAATVKVDGAKLTADGSGILTVPVSAGAHALAKADSCNLFYMAYEPAGQPAVTTTLTTTTTTVTTTTTADPVPAAGIIGDVNSDGDVDVSDAVLLARFIAEDSAAIIDNAGQINADTNHNGNLETADITLLLQFIAKMIDSL